MRAFLGQAPSDVIEKVREKQDVLLAKQQKIQINLDRIKAVEDCSSPPICEPEAGHKR